MQRQVTDESNGQLPTPPNSAGPKASENQAEKEAKTQNLMVLPDDSAEDSGAEKQGRKLSRQQTLPQDSSSDPVRMLATYLSDKQLVLMHGGFRAASIQSVSANQNKTKIFRAMSPISGRCVFRTKAKA